MSPLAGEWSKLQSTHVKPHWIKIDFDHFEISDNETEDEEKQMEKVIRNTSSLKHYCTFFTFNSK